MHRQTHPVVTPRRQPRARHIALATAPLLLLSAALHAPLARGDAATLAAAASPAAAPSYSAVDLYTLSAPADFMNFTVAQGNNASYGGATVGYGTTTGLSTHAIYWTPTGTATDFEPVNLPGIAASFLNATHGALQAGYGSGPGTNNNNHALLWNGTPNATDVNPAGFTFSQATGAGTTHAVGYGSGTATSNNFHAMLWTGTVGSDLNPATLTNSLAYGVDDTSLQAVGSGSGDSTGSFTHAVLWNILAGTSTDLHPSNLSGFTVSTAYGVGGHEQVGYGFGDGTAFHSHALLWRDSSVAVDLNPAGFTDSTAYATDGTSQVGYGLAASNAASHALLWQGSNAAVDLQAALPATFASSAAYGIDALGDVFGTATDASGNTHAVEWIAAVPEPTTTLWLGAMAVAPLLRRRRRSPDR